MNLLSDINAYIMTGGDSRRMKTNKSLVKLRGITLTERVHQNLSDIFDNIFVVGKKNNFPQYSFVQDIESVQCPLIGIITALEHSKKDWIFVIACDLLFVKPVTIKNLFDQINLKSQVILPIIEKTPQPLCAFYHKSALTHFKNAISLGDYAIHKPLNRLKVAETYIDNESAEQFININYPKDLERAFKTLG